MQMLSLSLEKEILLLTFRIGATYNKMFLVYEEVFLGYIKADQARTHETEKLSHTCLHQLASSSRKERAQPVDL